MCLLMVCVWKFIFVEWFYNRFKFVLGGLWWYLFIIESVIMKVEIFICLYNRWIKLIYINCSCIKIEGKVYFVWCIGMNKYELIL